MSTFEQVSHFCKIAGPFLAAAFILITAYGDRHGRWKLARSMVAAVFFLAVGFLLVFVG
jgi:hypothetical protein